MQLTRPRAHAAPRARRTARTRVPQSEGFDAIECCVDWLAPGFKEALDEAGLEFVAQLHTTAVTREGWEKFRYNTSCKIADHLASLKDLATEVS